MSKRFQRVQDLIGHTPLVRIEPFPSLENVNLYAKLESFNPGGSIKDRLGIALIEEGERSGKLVPGGTIIEPTAGNTGIGIALAAIGKSYQVIFVVPEQFSVEKQKLMQALGAKIVHTPTENGIKGAIKKAKELAATIPNSYLPEQFSNPANPEVHYHMTGPEIWEQMDGEIDMLVAGAGSGGTIMGVAQYLKEKNPQIQIVAVEPEGSILGGGLPGPHQTEGIGMEFIPDYFDRSYIDLVYTVSDRDAFSMVGQLARKAGLLVGSSSGAAFFAAWQEAQKAHKGTNIVVIFPDSSDRYLSKNIYD